MAQLTVQEASLAGLNPTYSLASATGDTFKNYGHTTLHVDNQDTVAKQLTIASNPCNYGENHDVVVSVPAGEKRVIGPFDTKRFNDDNFNVNITYDAATSLNVAVIKY